jgi:glycosyltransferase involved in cell wall biosynthesis
MRIGISTSVIQRGQSGVGQYVLALTRALLPWASRHRFTLFVLEEDLPLFDFARNEMELVSVNEAFRPPVKNILWHQARLPKLVRAKGLQLLHVPSYRRLLWPKPCRLVATIHDLAPFRLAGKYDWKRMFYGRLVARRLAQRQDHVIAVSQTTALDLANFYRLQHHRLTVIHNGIDHARFSPASASEAKLQIAQRYGLRHPFLLYVARLEHPAKNHVRLIAAFEQFKITTRSKWQLALAGGDWHGADAIHAAIRRSPSAVDIRCLGFVPEDDLPNLYRAAEVFVYPSLYEGFGLPPVEAMACGCPVISSARGALREVLAQAAALIEPEDILGLSNKLTLLATDAPARDRLRAAGLLQAQKFDWRLTAEQTMRVYEDIPTPSPGMKTPGAKLHSAEVATKVLLALLALFLSLAVYSC